MAVRAKVVLIVEYEGTRYHGFQFQENAPTIQEELERALEKLTGKKTRVIGASRTDAGVHAQGQVVSFRTGSSFSPTTWVRALNYYLPWDIAVKRAGYVRADFDVRREALSREYCYQIWNSPARAPLKQRFALLVTQPLEERAMDQACQTMVGRWDFASFASSMKGRRQSTVRTMYRTGVGRKGELVTIEMVADSFLPHQVRNTVGALIRVGQGRMGIEEFCGIAQARKPGLAGPAAPAHGLCLMKVNYPEPWGEPGNENL
ncbi:MAG: tRNA pseudouridine(38-40) synthase TruA [Dehalococcoidia bacterium]